MLFGLLYINTFAEKEYIAVPTNSKVLVDGKEIDFATYNIGENNYFKLGDLAIVLRDTDRGFDISIKSDNGKDLISLKPTSNKFPMQKYQPIGTELQKKC
jgi:hypothetical protein